MLHTGIRTDCIILEAFVRYDPYHPLVSKLAQGILDERKGGIWKTNQENSWAILSLFRYFSGNFWIFLKSFLKLFLILVIEKKNPNFLVRTWLHEKYCGEISFTGRQLKSEQLSISMPNVVQLSSNNTIDVLLLKDGTGHMYYSLHFQYAPKNPEVNAIDCGFTVSRAYYEAEETGVGEFHKIEKKSKLSLNSQGYMVVNVSKLIWVEIQVQISKKRNHVAIIDKLPAGVENDLKLSQKIRSRTEVWFNYENLRDERSECFATVLQEGIFTYSYICRATIKGTFLVPPTRVEETYKPQIFGTTDSSKLVIIP